MLVSVHNGSVGYGDCSSVAVDIGVGVSIIATAGGVPVAPVPGIRQSADDASAWVTSCVITTYFTTVPLLNPVVGLKTQPVKNKNKNKNTTIFFIFYPLLSSRLTHIPLMILSL
jgi:hypothetical protein